MLDIKTEKTDGKNACVHLEGELTVANISELHEKVCDLYDEVESLSFMLKENSSIDMTFVQLACIAHRAFTKAGKDFYVEGAQEMFFDNTDRMGFTRHRGCKFEENNNCVLVNKLENSNG